MTVTSQATRPTADGVGPHKGEPRVIRGPSSAECCTGISLALQVTATEAPLKVSACVDVTLQREMYDVCGAAGARKTFRLLPGALRCVSGDARRSDIALSASEAVRGVSRSAEVAERRGAGFWNIIGGETWICKCGA